MKRDGRSFDHRTLEVIRLMAVERVRAGERPSTVIASYGFSRTTIYKWIKAASHPGVAESAACEACYRAATPFDASAGTAGVPLG